MTMPKSNRQILEEALRADFDDLSTHSAYADLLIEEGDPRGEFIRLQLALEDRDRPARELQQMQQAASSLRFSHERDWLGDLAPLFMPPRRGGLVDPVEPNCSFGWSRGWLAHIHIFQLNDAVVRALAEVPQIRMLQSLEVHQTYHGDRAIDYQPWCESGHFSMLRSLVWGDREEARCAADGSMIVELVMGCQSTIRKLEILAVNVSVPRLFALPMPELRELQVAFNDDIALPILTANESLRQLTRFVFDARLHARQGEPERAVPIPRAAEIEAFCAAKQWHNLRELIIRCPGVGDSFCAALIHSGMMKQLRRLDLCDTDLTDEGAFRLAECPDTAGLQQLDVQGNHLSLSAVAALERLDIRVHAAHQHGHARWDDDIDDLPANLGGSTDVTIEDV